MVNQNNFRLDFKEEGRLANFTMFLARWVSLPGSAYINSNSFCIYVCLNIPLYLLKCKLTEALFKKITQTHTKFGFLQSEDSSWIPNSFAVVLIDGHVLCNLEEGVAWQLVFLLQVPFVIRDNWSLCSTSF